MFFLKTTLIEHVLNPTKPIFGYIFPIAFLSYFLID